MGYAQLVIGPAGSGKSTYCSSLYQHCEALRRTIHIVNLDPAAEHFDYPVSTGQIELFTHVPALRNFIEHLKRKNFNVCAVYLLDSQFITDVTKYISGCMSSLSAMVQLELPHVNILSKMDLVKNKKDIDYYLEPEARVLLSALNQHMAPQYGKLNKALAELVDEFSMVNFVPLDLRKEKRKSLNIISFWICDMSSSRSTPSTRSQDNLIFCRCNLQCEMYTCYKANNRGRKFYRCPRNRSEDDCRYFRWVDEQNGVVEATNTLRSADASEIHTNLLQTITYELLQIKI